jgi:hypothetical protein
VIGLEASFSEKCDWAIMSLCLAWWELLPFWGFLLEVTRKDSYLFSVIENGWFLEEEASTSKLKTEGRGSTVIKRYFFYLL